MEGLLSDFCDRFARVYASRNGVLPSIIELAKGHTLIGLRYEISLAKARYERGWLLIRLSRRDEFAGINCASSKLWIGSYSPSLILKFCFFGVYKSC